MSTRALPRIFLAVVLTVATFPLFAWNYDQCVGSKITWGSDTWVDFKISSVDFPEGEKRNALNAAIGAWNFAPGHPFTFVPTFLNFVGATRGNFSNQIVFSNTGFDDNILAVTKTLHSCTNLQEADIHFNSNYTWSYDANPTGIVTGYEPISFTGVAIHELGHAMGLQHVSSTLAMMAPIYPNGGSVGQGTSQHFQPLADDIQGARAGYPGWCCPVIYDLYSSAYGSYNQTQTGLIMPSTEAYRGGVGHYGFSIGNRGTASTTAQVNFYYSTDRNITTSDIFMGSTTVSLAPGAHPKAYVNFTIPMNFTPGYYYFGYIVDPNNAISEADEANNAVAMAYPTSIPYYTPPSPCFTFDPGWGVEDITEFNFDASCSFDTDGSIVSYSWNFGDGSGDVGPFVSHVFEAPGTFHVTLTVTDNNGLTSAYDELVEVGGASGCVICE
jgi:hypothetical protein